MDLLTFLKQPITPMLLIEYPIITLLKLFNFLILQNVQVNVQRFH